MTDPEPGRQPPYSNFPVQGHRMRRSTTFPGLRVGVIGAGAISHRHIAAWQSLGVTVIVQSPTSASAIADQYGIDFTESFDEVLPRVDVVDICTPTDTHAEIVMAAISAGRHVICEKPLARFGVDAKLIVHAAAEAGLQIFPAHVVRFFQPYAIIAAALRAGTIGTAHSLRFSRTGASPALPGSWFADVPRSGGIVLDLMIHDLDIARWFAGEVEAVYAQQSPPDRDGRLPRHVGAQIALTHTSGAISQLQGVWGMPWLPFRTTVDVFGESGVLRHDTAHGNNVSIEQGEPRRSTTSAADPSSIPDPYRDQLQEFAIGLTDGAAPRVNAWDGAAAVVLAEAALESIRTRQPILVR